MATIGDVFGWASNPVYQGLASNRNALMSFGAGLASGNNWNQGLANGLQGLQQGAQKDDAWALVQEEKAKEQQALNQTTEWLKANGQDALYNAVSSGAMAPGDAWRIALEQQAQARAASQGPEPTANMRDYMFSQENPGYAQFLNPTSANTMPDAPSGYQWVPGQNGQMQQTYIPGGPADPANQGKTTEAQRRNQQLSSVIQPELQNVENNWTALADGGNQGWNNPVTGAVTGSLASPEYQTARNSLAVIAQSYLYSVSGAAATDAEVQKIVDSVTPKPFESPASVADKKRRIQQMANAVIQAGGGNSAAQPAAPANGGFTILGIE
jgi:hypothetical protein